MSEAAGPPVRGEQLGHKCQLNVAMQFGLDDVQAARARIAERGRTRAMARLGVFRSDAVHIPVEAYMTHQQQTASRRTN